MIVSFASSKGGVGKSTSCAAVGARFAQRGEQVLIIDLDQNRTLERWGRKANVPGLTVKAIERDDFTNVFRETMLAGEIDHVLIDLAGAREATVLKAIARSELVVIPAQASEPDLREALVIVSDIKDVAEEKGEPIPYRVLLTKMHPFRTRDGVCLHRTGAPWAADFPHGHDRARGIQGDVPDRNAARVERQCWCRGGDGGADGGDRGDH